MSGNKYASIFQGLENGNHKGALKHCNVLLKKKPDDQLGKVLKAICLQRSNEIEEAIKIADEVSSVPHSQDIIFHNLNYLYKCVKQSEKMVKVYEVSYNANQKSESLAEGLFLAYARVRNFKQQQQMAISINKTFPDRIHSIWYLMTMLSMVRDNPENKLFIQISQKMAEKLASEGKFQSVEDLYIYEEILDLQGKFKEHLELLEGDLGKLYTVPTERLKVVADLQDKLGKHLEASESYKEVITKYEHDEWSCYMGYFNQIWKIGSVEKNKLVDLIKSIQSEIKSSNSRILRGPFIAEIEIEYRFLLEESNSTQGDLKNFKELILSYFKNFGNKPIFYYDMKKYLNFLNKSGSEEIKEFLKSLHELVSVGEKDRISHLSNYYKVHRLLSMQSNLNELQTRELITEYVKEYQIAYDHIQKNQQQQQSSERLQGDDILILAYQLLHDLYDSTGESRFLIEGITLMEYGFKCSPKNFQFNLIAMKLYYKMGDHSKGLEHFQILRIKNIQWDTIGYLILDDVIRSLPNLQDTYSFFEKSNKFYNENDATGDYISACFQNQNYSKIQELMKFQDKINNSYQQHANYTERALFTFFISKHKVSSGTTSISSGHNNMDISLVPENAYNIDSELFKKFSFNFDKDVQDRFDQDEKRPKFHYQVGTTSLSLSSNSRNQLSDSSLDQDFLKDKLLFRRLILKLLVESNKMIKQQFNNESLDNYKSLLEQLKLQITKIQNQQSITDINSSKDFDDFMNQQIIIGNFTLFINIYSHIKASQSDNLETIKSDMKSLQENYGKAMNYISSQLFYNEENKIINPTAFRLLSVYLEVTTWFQELLNNLSTILPTKKQKKKEESHMAIRNDYDATINKLVELLSGLELKITTIKLSNLSINNDIIDTYSSLLKFTSKLTNDETVEPLLVSLKNSSISSIIKSTNQSFDEYLLYIKSMKSNLTINTTN